MPVKTSRLSLPGYEQTSSGELAKAINAHFGGICSTLPALDMAQLPAYLPPAAPPPTVTRSQVWKELGRIKVHKAPGPDDLPDNLLKVFAFEISEPVCSIIGASLYEGVMPSEWKRATVVPVPKINPPPSMDKLRPASLTPALAKVAETFISIWIMEDMKPNLDSRQFGNCKARSKSHYLVLLVHLAFQALKDSPGADFLPLITVKRLILLILPWHFTSFSRWVCVVSCCHGWETSWLVVGSVPGLMEPIPTGLR